MNNLKINLVHKIVIKLFRIQWYDRKMMIFTIFSVELHGL